MVLLSLWNLLACSLASASVLTPSQAKYSLLEVPAGWIEVSDVTLPPAHSLTLRFGLAHRFSELESLLHDISDPSHPSYGSHLTKEEVHVLSTPSDDSLQKVQDWLLAHDISAAKWSPAKDSASVVLPISAAEEMLSTRFGLFEHIETRQRIVRALSYSLPEFLVDHIDYVHPTTAFLDPRRHGLGKIISKREAISAPLNQSDFVSCLTVMDPPCMRTVYNVGNYTPDASLPNHLGVTGYLNVSARQDSFKLYLNDYIPESIGSNFTFDIVNITGPWEQIESDEGNLDTQLAIQAAYPIPITYYTTTTIPPSLGEDGNPAAANVNEPYLDFLDYILGLDDPPTVITTSYGDDEQTVPKDYATAVCQGFAKLGARGVSVLFSTGDQGLGIDFLPNCIANTGDNATTFLPDFPASCPYVTTVGQSTGAAFGEGFIPQIAQGNSGAGFSNYFDRPSYQDAAVSAYLNGPAAANQTAMQASMYNPGGRAYPDMVLIGSGAFFDNFNNRWDIGEGTSASVPTAAGIIALLNDWRLRNGRPTMGFLNPFLYGVGSAGFVDITFVLVLSVFAFFWFKLHRVLITAARAQLMGANSRDSTPLKAGISPPVGDIRISKNFKRLRYFECGARDTNDLFSSNSGSAALDGIDVFGTFHSIHVKYKHRTPKVFTGLGRLVLNLDRATFASSHSKASAENSNI